MLLPRQITRRRFLAATATGTAAATGVAAKLAVPGESAPAERSLGRFRIDVQSHLHPPELLDFMEQRALEPRVVRNGKVRQVVVGDWTRTVKESYSDPLHKLAAMDANGIEMAAISINDPGPERFGQDGAEVARIANDYLTGIARAHPNRFLPLIALPLQDIPASMAELGRCVDQLGMRGILLYTNIDGEFPDEPRFRWLFAEAERRNLPILLHPAYPTTFPAVQAQLAGGLGMMFDNTIALTRIIMAGILDEFPRLRLLCPHIGGTLPYLIGRLDHQTHVLMRAPATLRRRPSEYLRNVYFDVVNPLPDALRMMYDMVGPDRLLFASDHPWVDPKIIVDCVEALHLSEQDRLKIYRDNARSFFGLA